jgi:hypothetical protein
VFDRGGQVASMEATACWSAISGISFAGSDEFVIVAFG